MKFTAFSIKSQEFSKSIRGYDVEEVKIFLENLAGEFEKISKDNEKFKSDIDSLNNDIKEYKKIEKSLQSALASVDESTSKTMDSAKKKAALIIKEAEIKSVQLVEHSRADAERIRETIIKLREEKNFLIAKLKAMVTLQNDLLEISKRNIVESNKKFEHNIIEKSPTDINDKDIDIDEILEKLL